MSESVQIKPALEQKNEAVDGLTPFEAQELRAAALRPDLMINLLLAQWPRLCSNIAQNRELGLLLSLLLGATILFSLPYAAVLGMQALGKIALLYLGSMLICFPSLHIFTSFLGQQSSLLQNLLQALLQTSTASLFTLGFAPVLWFLGLTMGKGSWDTFSLLSSLLLTASAFAGIIQFFRCLHSERSIIKVDQNPVILVVWQVLLLFINFQMARLIGLI